MYPYWYEGLHSGNGFAVFSTFLTLFALVFLLFFLTASLQCSSTAFHWCAPHCSKTFIFCTAGTEARKSNLTCTQSSKISPAGMNWKNITDTPIKTKKKIGIAVVLCKINFLLLGLKLVFLQSYTSHTFLCRLSVLPQTGLFSMDFHICRYCMNANEFGFIVSVFFIVLFRTQLLSGAQGRVFSSPTSSLLLVLSWGANRVEKCMGLHCVYVLGFDHTVHVWTCGSLWNQHSISLLM